MSMIKTFFALALFILTRVNSLAQLDPLYAQYLNNPILLNPAYTGINNRFNAVVAYRKQWASFDGSPTTFSFASHMSFRENNKVGAGLIAVVDKIGDSRNTEISGTYSYKLDLGKNSGEKTLSFGLQAGMMNFRNDLTSVYPRDPNDPAFAFVNESRFNLGAGVMVKTETYLLGFSAPRIIPTTIGQGGQKIQVYGQHFYLLGSYVFYLSEYVRLKPSVLVKATHGAPVSADLNFNLNLEQRYTVGILTRNFTTYGLLVQMNIKDYRVGYVFEAPTNNSLGTPFTSHEISISLAMRVLSSHSSTFSNF